MAKILYVEDHLIQQEIMRQMLAWRGFEVAVASNGLEGLEKAASWSPDLILMDLRMPRMGGFKAIEQIRNCPETANIPIIALSAWASGNHKKRALGVGANEHFTKPVDMNRLVPTIETYLTKKG